MHVKVFSGKPEEVEAQVEDWLERNERITFRDRLQSQSEGRVVCGGPETVLTITIFYDN